MCFVCRIAELTLPSAGLSERQAYDKDYRVWIKTLKCNCSYNWYYILTSCCTTKHKTIYNKAARRRQLNLKTYSYNWFIDQHAMKIGNKGTNTRIPIHSNGHGFSQLLLGCIFVFVHHLVTKLLEQSAFWRSWLVGVPAYSSRGPGSIPGVTRFSEK
jgi:hypothetical protein